MVTGMEKIFRLSLANIRKHKLEAAALVLLVALCMLLLGSTLGTMAATRTIFPQILEHTQGMENFILIQEKNYDPEFKHIIEEDERIEEVQTAEMLYSMSSNYLDREGKEQALYLAFITEFNNNRIQKTELDTTLSEAELAAIEHPITMPYTMHDTMGYRAGDPFDVIIGTRKYSFTIAGFYDTLILDQVSSGVKMIVSDEDYHLLSAVMPNYVCIGYNDHRGQGGETLFFDLLEKMEDYSNLDVKNGIRGMVYEDLEIGVTFMLQMVMKLLIAMAVIIILAVAIMIRFRITGDIRDQIVHIGVLEALGYTSGEITLSYVIEYLLIALAGVILGTAGSFLLIPALFHVFEMISEHRGTAVISVLPVLLGGLAILAFVALIAFIRARMVRNYPPVRAFRKGQGDHRFGKEHFPLRNTKHNVHLRMALKGFAENWRQNLGLTVCILISSTAVIFSFIIFSFFTGNMNAIAASAGVEMSDLCITLMPSADAYVFSEELMALPEVRKATPTASENLMVTAADYNEPMFPISFKDFSVTENIFPASGRFPEHDNEIMVTNMFARHFHLKNGDTLTLEHLKVQKKFIITGLVTSSTNGGINLYITEEGLQRLIPTYRPDGVEVYLEDGADPADFRYTLTRKYGRSLSDTAGSAAEGVSCEERIRAEAEQQIAEMMANYGVTHAEYAIRYGDKVISGDSSGFQIVSIQNLNDILQTQLAGMSSAIEMLSTLFAVLAAVVIAVILFILMEATIRRQRKEFGIMKGMGYTSRELMVQLAMRIMPAALIAVILGTVIGVAATGLLTSYIGRIGVNMPLVILADILILAYCFGCAYLGARKIKKISVYELMTE